MYSRHVVVNVRRKGSKHGIDGLCIVTKTNAWDTVRCESVERSIERISGHFLVEAWLKVVGGWRSAVRMGVRNVFKVIELNNSQKQRAYQEGTRALHSFRERSERVGSPGVYVTEFHASIFAWPCVLSDHSPVLCWLSTGEGWGAVI